jgi:hypothetical protein
MHEHVFVSDQPLVSRVGRPPDPNSTAVPRECPRHGLIALHRYRRGDRYVYRCKRCIGEAVTRRHRRVRATLIAEAGGCCAVCGYARCSINLHFHHVDPSAKAFEMHMGVGKSLAAFREEATKCVLVCANCHGEIEAGVIASPPPRARWTGVHAPAPGAKRADAPVLQYPQRDSNPRSPP